MDLSGGAVIEGGNGKGKTSVLKLIRAALVEKGATPDMIRKGATSGEILVRVDNHMVRRVMTQGEKFRTTLRVTDEHGTTVPEPATFLKNLLGISPLDPIELFLEKDKGKRRARILSAIPCAVTETQLASWCPPGANLLELVGDDGMGNPALDGHGLEIIERARKVLYAKRTDANRVVKERSVTADKAIADEGNAYDALSAYRIQHGLPDKAPALGDAERVLNNAKRAEITLDEQRRAAETSAKAQTKTREKIATLRQKASDLRANQPIAPKDELKAEAAQAVLDCAESVVAAQAIVNDLETQLAKARESLREHELAKNNAELRVRVLDEQQKKAEKNVDDIADIEGQALELEQALGALPIALSEAQFVEAERATAKALAAVEYAKKANALVALADASDSARTMLKSAQEDAAALDKAVKALADDAPAALLSAADGVPGLSIDGDDVFLDGVSLDQLSGQERLFFAVEIARRLNAKSKLLCVDGLEALDADHRRAFIERATADGFQLIATRVADQGGDPVAVPIRADS